MIFEQQRSLVITNVPYCTSSNKKVVFTSITRDESDESELFQVIQNMATKMVAYWLKR